MKRIAILSIILILLTSCSILEKSPVSNQLLVTDQQCADKRIEVLLDALENQDRMAVESMFSPKALEEVTAFDEHLDYLFEFFQGNVLSWKLGGGPFTDYSREKDGRRVRNITAWYKVNTDEQNYIFIFIECLKDTKELNNVGLYTLRVIHAEDKDTEFSYKEIPGIYKPE